MRLSAKSGLGKIPEYKYLVRPTGPCIIRILVLIHNNKLSCLIGWFFQCRSESSSRVDKIAAIVRKYQGQR